MKFLSILILTSLFFVSCKNDPKSKEIEALNNDVNKEEWIALFNGKNLDNWEIKITGHEVGDNYNNTFKVEDSMICAVYNDYESFGNSFGHLYYTKPYSYYKLKMDYRFVGNQVEGGESWANRNSGVMFHAQSAESNSLGQFFPISLEFQFLGGLGEGDRPTGNLCTPGTAVVLKDSVVFPHCINSSSKTYDGDQWVSAELVVLGDEKIVHIINNDTVMTYFKPIIGGGLISQNQEEEWKNFGIDNQEEWLAKDGKPLKDGYLALQAESSPIDFKNIELLDLCGCMDKKAKNYKSYYVKEDNDKCVYD